MDPTGLLMTPSGLLLARTQTETVSRHSAEATNLATDLRPVLLVTHIVLGLWEAEETLCDAETKTCNGSFVLNSMGCDKCQH